MFFSQTAVFPHCGGHERNVTWETVFSVSCTEMFLFLFELLHLSKNMHVLCFHPTKRTKDNMFTLIQVEFFKMGSVWTAVGPLHC